MKLILALLLVCLCMPACADYAVFSDNFDDGNWTAAPLWEPNPAGPITVSDEQSASGQYSLKVASSLETGAIRATSGLGAVTQEYSCTFNFYVQSMGDEAIPWCLQNSAGSLAVIIFILPNGKVQLTNLDGQTSNVPGAMSYGQWHSFRVTYDGSTTNLYLDGHETPDASITRTYAYVPSTIVIGNFGMPHTSTFYIDDLTIRADISPAKVYVQMCSDTSVDGLNTSSHYNHFPEEDSAYTSPTGEAAQVMAASYRDALRDSLGNTMKFTWYMLCGSMYSYGTTTGPLLSYELMTDYHGDEIEQWGDEMAYHYHTWLWYDMDGDGVYAWDQAPDFSYCVDDFEFTVAHLILDRGIYPCSFRSGWHYMDNIFMGYLDDWYPYRFENGHGANIWNHSPPAWVPYHPDWNDYQIPGDMRGWESRCMYMKSIDSAVVGEIFSAAQAGTSQVLTAWSHLQEHDFPTQASDVHALLTAAHEAFPLVDFEYLTGRGCMLKWRNGTDATPPEIQVSTSDEDGIRTAVFSTNEAIYQIQPFIAHRSTDGTYSRKDCAAIGPNQWQVQYALADTVSIGVGLTDWFGNAAVRFLPAGFTIADITTSSSSDSAEIGWTTNLPADTTLEYGLAFSNEMTTIHETDRVLAHHAGLQGLLPGRVYKLRAKADNELGQHAESADFYILTKLNDEIIIDNTDAGFSIAGYWNTGTGPGKYDADYRWASTSPTGTLHADWSTQIQESGLYRVYAWWPQGSNRSNEARYAVFVNETEDPIIVNQQTNGAQWNLFDTYDLNAGDTVSVRLSNNAPSGYVVIADAIKIEPAYIPLSGVGLARLVPDGSRIRISDVAVTAVFGSEYYVEATDRSAGMKIAGTGVSPGDLLEISGEASTVSGERVIVNPVISKLPGTFTLTPLAMTGTSIGLRNERSLVTSGLLVRIMGEVTSVGDGCFSVNDGSVEVRVDASGLPVLPDLEDYLIITGLVGSAIADGKTGPLLRPRDSSDITAY